MLELHHASPEDQGWEKCLPETSLPGCKQYQQHGCNTGEEAANQFLYWQDKEVDFEMVRYLTAGINTTSLDHVKTRILSDAGQEKTFQTVVTSSRISSLRKRQKAQTSPLQQWATTNSSTLWRLSKRAGHLATRRQAATVKLQTDITTVRNGILCPQIRERLSLCSEIGEGRPISKCRKKSKNMNTTR